MANETESNNAFATANTLTLGIATTGQLSTSSDLDFYKINATAAGSLSIVLDVPTSNAYSDYFTLGLFNSSGTLLSQFATGTDKTYTVGAPTAGTYYVGIQSGSYYYSSGQYSITVSNTAGSTSAFEAEANNTIATANALALGSATTGQLSTSSDLDFYKINGRRRVRCRLC